VDVLRTDFEFQGTAFSHFFLFVGVLGNYSEQILSCKELFFRIIFVHGSTENRF